MARCEGVTKKGKPCQGGAIPGIGLCGPHHDATQRGVKPRAGVQGTLVHPPKQESSLEAEPEPFVIWGEDWLDDDDVMLGYIAESRRLGLWK